MHHIERSQQHPGGVLVSWSDAGKEASEVYSYEDLVDQKINALDLLNNPDKYSVNPAGHKIELSVTGCSFAHRICEDDIVITRFFDAPRELVWRAWSDPE